MTVETPERVSVGYGFPALMRQAINHYCKGLRIMARYLETAKGYENLPEELLELIPEENRERGAELIARVANAGFRGNPRAANGTIRLNYLQALLNRLPVSLRLVEVEKENGYSFKALEVSYTG